MTQDSSLAKEGEKGTLRKARHGRKHLPSLRTVIILHANYFLSKGHVTGMCEEARLGRLGTPRLRFSIRCYGASRFWGALREA